MDNYLNMTIEIHGIDENESIQPIQLPIAYTCRDLKRDIIEEFKELRTGPQTQDGALEEYALWMQNGVRELTNDVIVANLAYGRELRLIFAKRSDSPIKNKSAYKTPIPMTYSRKDLPEALQHVGLQEVVRGTHHLLRYEAAIIGRDTQIANPRWPQIGRIGIESAAYVKLPEDYRRSLSSEHAIVFYEYEDGTFYIAQVNPHQHAQSYLNGHRLNGPTQERNSAAMSYSVYPLQHGDFIALGHEGCYQFAFLREG